MSAFLEPTQQSAMALLGRRISGSIVMLNLLRFRDMADYTQTPELAPAKPITGEAAFDLYVEGTLPLLRESGGELLFMGAGGDFFIGPAGERWDRAMLVRQSSLESFFAFAGQQAYQSEIIGHRTAALMDSRLLPLVPIESAGSF